MHLGFSLKIGLVMMKSTVEAFLSQEDKLKEEILGKDNTLQGKVVPNIWSNYATVCVFSL